MLCLTFCKITKAHLKRILSDEEALSGLRADVGPLVKAVVATNRFERDMATAFGGGGGGGAGRQGGGEEGVSYCCRGARMGITCRNHAIHSCTSARALTHTHGAPPSLRVDCVCVCGSTGGRGGRCGLGVGQ